MRKCSICGETIGASTVACAACGAPVRASAARGQRSACKLCQKTLYSLAETCVHCGARGYPALRPRTGDRFQGAPEDDEAGA